MNGIPPILIIIGAVWLIVLGVIFSKTLISRASR
jgi:hypothetical protein